MALPIVLWWLLPMVYYLIRGICLRNVNWHHPGPDDQNLGIIDLIPPSPPKKQNSPVSIAFIFLHTSPQSAQKRYLLLCGSPLSSVFLCQFLASEDCVLQPCSREVFCARMGSRIARRSTGNLPADQLAVRLGLLPQYRTIYRVMPPGTGL